MRKIISTDASNWIALIARIALGITIFPHGAQKLLGWFGGDGFYGTMNYFTEVAGFPYIVALFIILIEFFGSLLLIFGAFTRISALGILGLFTGIAFVNLPNGFFMNWMGNQAGEGIEYFVLLIGLATISLVIGGGRASVDAALVKIKGQPVQAKQS